jgi:hypothetical protein
MMSKHKIILVRESILQSIIADFITFGFMTVSFWFNEKFIHSGFMNGIILVMFLMFMINRAGTSTKIIFGYDKAINILKSYLESEASNE